ncbi:hypothetical protein BD626DRAFT_419802 [Schizophyllum amplum]|uniref:Uncharacterized protein n=1 Tax=Schizophyllum amplum TaxID=97359 RepID=A0A550BRQ0_9AGAR|nr:hypothetical protein BD626DRAFT_419802 [Auriculariopsis ampla]
MELGAPMVAMYLVNNPDHYTSHRFKPFFWHPYVAIVREFWLPEEDKLDEERVLLMKKRGNVVGVSETQNYVYRSKSLESTNLYYFMRCCQRTPLSFLTRQNKRDRTTAAEPSASSVNVLPENATDDHPNPKGDMNWHSDEDEDDVENEDVEGSDDDMREEESEHKHKSTIDRDGDIHMTSDTSDEEPDVLPGPLEDPDWMETQSGVFGEPPTRDLGPNNHAFLKGHALASTHFIKEVKDDPSLVLNYMRTLPRSDGVDLERYYMTMLTLFKPWRTGEELKGKDETWQIAFRNHPFTEDEKLLMKFFNLRWECIDSRDDFRRKLADGQSDLMEAVPFSSDTMQDIDREQMTREQADNMIAILDTYNDISSEVNTYYALRKKAFDDMKDVMVSHLWSTARLTIPAPPAHHGQTDCLRRSGRKLWPNKERRQSLS